MDKTRFYTSIAELLVAFRRDIDDITISAYWKFLKDLTESELEAAVEYAGKNLKFMPSPAELREFSGRPTSDSRAEMAFQSVVKAIADHGSYKTVVFEDPLINPTIRVICLWTELCEQSDDELFKYTRPRFVRIYNGFDRTGVPLGIERTLGGLSETGTIRKIGCSYRLPEIKQLPAIDTPKQLTRKVWNVPTAAHPSPRHDEVR